MFGIAQSCQRAWEKYSFLATCPFSVHSILIAHGIDSNEENRIKSMLNDAKDIQKPVSFTSNLLPAYKCPSGVLERHIRLCKYKHSGGGEMWPLRPLGRVPPVSWAGAVCKFSDNSPERRTLFNIWGKKGTEGWFSPRIFQAAGWKMPSIKNFI